MPLYDRFRLLPGCGAVFEAIGIEGKPEKQRVFPCVCLLTGSSRFADFPEFFIFYVPSINEETTFRLDLAIQIKIYRVNYIR